MAKAATKTKNTKKAETAKTPKESTGTKEKAFKNLVIVESPAKAKTIKKILGDSFEIKASYGHIRDFPKKVMGFDADNDFEPTFEIIPEKKKVVEELNKAAKGVDKIYLAPDPDREGEAIAWHIAQVLNVAKSKILRIEFNEITKNAIIEAVQNPRAIDDYRVNAQKTRQILDRVVGYKLSPLLWKKLSNYRLSAGRVQSVAVKLICEREKEIENFISEEYWTVQADLSKVKSQAVFQAELTKFQNKKIEIKNEEEAQKIYSDLTSTGVEFNAVKVTTRNTKRNPQAPFITSTLQREASSKLGFTVNRTMQVAQKLYEGIEMGSSGPIGLITYMRTDSTRISDEAKEDAKNYIIQHFGKEYYPKEARSYAKKGKNVQDAHEAIRPTYVEQSPAKVKQYLTSEQYRLYKLVWDRFIASQMESADVKNIAAEIQAAEYIFRASTSTVMFNGFLIVYDDRDDEQQEKPQSKIPEIKEGDKFKCHKILPEQHFTQPPPRYSEASLVKTLEEKGIGRPSTYASIITKIQQRTYVVKEEKSLVPTPLGKVVNEQLVNNFSDIINYEFTADMENKLDDIALNKEEWKKVIGDFYNPFIDSVDRAEKTMEKVEILTEHACPNCSSLMRLKTSRWGTQFLACSAYPECKTTMPADNKGEVIEQQEARPSDELCAKCGSAMEIRKGPYGDYLLCTKEECKNKQKLIKRTGVKCPQSGCAGEIIEKKSRYGKIFYGCDKYPECNFALWSEPSGEKCPECGSMLVKKYLKRGNKIACSSKECSFQKPMEE